MITVDKEYAKSFIQFDGSKLKFITPVEARMLLDYVKKNGGIRNYAMIAVGYFHGLRISEITKLQFEHWNEETRRLWIIRAKNGKSAQYPVCEEVHRALKAWVTIRGRMSGPMFISQMTKLTASLDNGRMVQTLPIKGISEANIHIIFKKYSTAIGISKDRTHWHILRHGIAVNMVEKGIPLIQIQDWLGHKNIQSTLVYATVSDETRNKTAEHLYAGEAMQGENKVKIDWKKDRKKRKG